MKNSLVTGGAGYIGSHTVVELVANGFDPDDKALTIGHPKVAQVNLMQSFGTEDYNEIWSQLSNHLDVYKIQTDQCEATYNYHWSDADFITRQIQCIQGAQS